MEGKVKISVLMVQCSVFVRHYHYGIETSNCQVI